MTRLISYVVWILYLLLQLLTTKKHTSFYYNSECRSKNREVTLYGETFHGRKVPAAGKIQHTVLYPLPSLWSSPFRITEVWDVPDLLPGTCTQRSTSWRKESQLVRRAREGGNTHGNDRPNC